MGPGRFVWLPGSFQSSGDGLGSGGFPGSTVSENFHSPDGAALSPPSTSVPGTSVRVWTHTGSRDSILTYAAGGFLHASFSTGDGRFTPPVAITGDNTGGSTPQDVRVVWLQTSGHADAVARSRDGDAILIFTQRQQAFAGQVNSTATDRLWSAYFNRDFAGTPSAT